MNRKLWNKDFILLLQGNAVSTIGDMMYSIAIGYWVFEKTGSSGLMGVMSAISMFVSTFLSPFSGSIVDKCNRRWLLTGIDLMQGFVMLGIGFLAYTDALSIPIVLISAFLAALGSAFYSPAVSTLRIDLIPRDDMVRGQSIFSGISSAIRMTGNAFSGVMVAFFGVPLIVIINGLSNLYSALTELFIHVPRTVRQGEQVSVRGLLQDTKQAILVILSDQNLKLFIPCSLLVNLLAAGPFSLMLPFCLEKGFSIDMYGLLMSAFTSASFACVLILSTIKLKPNTRYWLMSLGYLSSILFLTTTYLTVHFIPMCICLFAASFFMCAGNTVFNAELMLALPNQHRGAILGFLNSASIGGTALSTVVYGFLGDHMPMHLLFASGALISIIPMFYTFLNPRTKDFMLKH